MQWRNTGDRHALLAPPKEIMNLSNTFGVRRHGLYFQGLPLTSKRDVLARMHGISQSPRIFDFGIRLRYN